MDGESYIQGSYLMDFTGFKLKVVSIYLVYISTLNMLLIYGVFAQSLFNQKIILVIGSF